MRINDLDEGVTFKKKQENEALDRNDINVGIEYEFRAFYNDKSVDAKEAEYILKDENIPFISKIVAESHRQVELITEIMNINQSLKHMKHMFSYFNDSEKGLSLESISQSGMHISISYKNYKLENINFLKFALLMSSKYFTSIFPEREYVKDFDRVIDEVIKYYIDVGDKRKFADMIPDMEKRFGKHADHQGTHIKYHGIKLSDYAIYDGRIELRFFGGKGYERRFDEIKQQLARAIHILGISYTNMYDDVYYRELYKRYHKILDRSKSLTINYRIDAYDSFSSLPKEDKELFMEATKLMKQGEMPPDGINIENYFKLVKKFFPKKLEKYIEVNEYIPKLSANRAISFIDEAGLRDYIDMIMDKFDENTQAELVYMFIHRNYKESLSTLSDFIGNTVNNSKMSLNQIIDVVGEDRINLMMDSQIDKIRSDDLNEHRQTSDSNKLYFKTAIFPLSSWGVNSMQFELYEINALSGNTKEKMESLLNDSINQMEETLNNDPYAFPSIKRSLRLYELLGREDEFRDMASDIFKRANDEIDSDKTHQHYDERKQYVKNFASMLSIEL